MFAIVRTARRFRLDTCGLFAVRFGRFQPCTVVPVCHAHFRKKKEEKKTSTGSSSLDSDSLETSSPNLVAILNPEANATVTDITLAWWLIPQMARQVIAIAVPSVCTRV